MGNTKMQWGPQSTGTQTSRSLWLFLPCRLCLSLCCCLNSCLLQISFLHIAGTVAASSSLVSHSVFPTPERGCLSSLTSGTKFWGKDRLVQIMSAINPWLWLEEQNFITRHGLCVRWFPEKEEASYRVPAGEGSLVHAIFWPPLSSIRMGLEPGALPHQEIKSLYSLCWACYFVLGISFPIISHSMCAPLFCLSMCQMAPGPLLYLSPARRAQEGCVQANCYLEGPTGHRWPTPTTDADLALCLLCE